MILFAAFCTLSFVNLLSIWLLATRLDAERSLPDAVVGVLVVTIMVTVVLGAAAAVVLDKETEPHYYPVIIKTPTLAEKP